MTTDIALPATENINSLAPAIIFQKGGIQPILDAIRDEVIGEVPDLETEKGRKQIASLAHKVSRSKTALDAMGKDLADELNAQLKPINAERKLARDTLDALRDEVRKPLNDFEAAKEAALRAENERLEAEHLAKQKEESHEMALLMNDKFDRDQVAIIEAERVANQERDQLIEKQAIENEHKRLAAQKAAEEKDVMLREASKAHVSSVRTEAKEALMKNCGLDENTAKKVIVAIHAKLIPSVAINY